MKLPPLTEGEETLDPGRNADKDPELPAAEVAAWRRLHVNHPDFVLPTLDEQD